MISLFTLGMILARASMPSGVEYLPALNNLNVELKVQDIRVNQPQLSDPGAVNLAETDWVAFFDLWLIENPNSNLKLGPDRKNDVDMAGKFQLHICPGNLAIQEKINSIAGEKFRAVLNRDLKDWDILKKKGQLNLFPVWKEKLNSHWQELRKPLSIQFKELGLKCMPDLVSKSRPERSALEPVRLPTRRWMGGLSIRAEIELLGKRLSGSFLIDSSAPVSLIDPAWLSRQGINPDLLRAVSKGTRKVNWVAGSGLGAHVEVEKLIVSNQVLAWRNFHFFTLREKIGEPYSPSLCCDGVLGRDFLAQAVLQLGGDHPTVIHLFPNSSEFVAPKGWEAISVRWNELQNRFESDGVWVPSASAVTESKKGKVVWDLTLPDRIKWGRYPIKSFFLADLILSSELKIQGIEAPTGASGLDSVTFATSFLFETGIIWDLPHGKVWLPPGLRDLKDRNWKTTHSGIEFEFKLLPQGRVLTIQSIRLESPANDWRKQGLDRGAIITKLNESDVSGLDYWEVKRIFDGTEGNTIRIEWQTKNKFTKIDSFQLKKN